MMVLPASVWTEVRAVAPLIGQFAAILLASHFVVVFGYRIFLHPLRKYPGPGLAKISDLYGVYCAFSEDSHLRIYQNLKKYGPVIRQGPNKLVFNSVAAVKDIYQNPDVTKSTAYNALTTMPPTHSVFDTLNRSLHRIKRQRIAPILSPKSMRTFEPQMQAQIDIFLRTLLERCQKTPGASLGMKKSFRWFTLNVVTLLAFGYDAEMQTTKKNQYLVDHFQSSNWRFNMYFQAPWLKYQFIELSSHLLDRVRGGTVFGFISMLIQNRMSQEKHAKQDLYSHMMKQLDAPDNTDGFSFHEIWSEAIMFTTAGSDTSATTMAGLVYYLSRNPECKEKLLREIQATFKSGRDIQSGLELSNCVYLRACIDETMRMSPASPGVLWRQRSMDGEADSGKPLIVDGHVIPPGTHVGVCFYAIHHNEEYFPDPFTYKPERWLSDEGVNDGAAPQANRAAFIPFSTGDRSCAGKAMASMEISLWMTKLLWYFDFELAAESQKMGDEFVILDNLAGTHEELYMHFYPRGELWKELVAASP